MKDYLGISILINTSNRANILPKVLDCLLIQDYPEEKIEILVLNDASRDNTIEILEKYFQKFKKKGFLDFKIYTNKKNRHIAWGRKFLSSKISDKSSMVLFLDDDAFLRENCIKKLASKLFEREDRGVVGPKIVHYKFPDKMAHGAFFVNPWTGIYTEIDSGQELECDWLNGTCFLVKKIALNKSGGFRSGFYVSHQEADFCLKVKKTGFKVLYYPEVIVKHDIEIKKRKTERLYYVYRNKMLVIHGNFSLPNKIIALSLICILGLPKYLFDSIVINKGCNMNEIKIILKAVWDGARGRFGKGL